MKFFQFFVIPVVELRVNADADEVTDKFHYNNIAISEHLLLSCEELSAPNSNLSDKHVAELENMLNLHKITVSNNISSVNSKYEKIDVQCTELWDFPLQISLLQACEQTKGDNQQISNFERQSNYYRSILEMLARNKVLISHGKTLLGDTKKWVSFNLLYQLISDKISKIQHTNMQKELKNKFNSIFDAIDSGLSNESLNQDAIKRIDLWTENIEDYLQDAKSAMLLSDDEYYELLALNTLVYRISYTLFKCLEYRNSFETKNGSSITNAFCEYFDAMKNTIEILFHLAIKPREVGSFIQNVKSSHSRIKRHLNSNDQSSFGSGLAIIGWGIVFFIGIIILIWKLQ